MKALPCFFTALFCLATCLAKAQFNKSSQARFSGTNQPLTEKIWSEWYKNSGNSSLEASYAKLTEKEITLRLRNTGTVKMDGEFTANECPENQKAVSVRRVNDEV